MKKSLYSNVIILSVGAIFAKVFSAAYRILLTRILGGEGIGLYQLIFPIYSLFVVITTTGLPMAISKVVSKHKENQIQVLKKCTKYNLIFSSLFVLILILLSKPLATLQGETNIFIYYIILAPTIILVGFSSVLRGYFQGKENFTPSAVSNIIEQFIKLTLGLTLSFLFIKRGVIYAVGGAVLGIFVGEIFSVLTLLLFYNRANNLNNIDDIKDVKLTFKNLMTDILPILLTNVILPIAGFVDSVLVVNLLGVNFTKKMSIFLYGLESGAVNSLAMLPTIFSYTIASVILPSISTNERKTNNSLKLITAMRIVLIITIPCVICFTFIPNRMIELLYGKMLNGYGVDGLNIAERLLILSGIGTVFLSLNQVYSSCLQAVDKRNVTIRNLIIGVLCKFIFELIFLPSVMVNIYALAVSNTVCYVIVMVLNHLEIRDSFNLHFDFMFAGKLAVANCALLLNLIYMLNISNTWQNTLLSIFISGLIYLGILFLMKIFNKKELAMLKYKVR